MFELKILERLNDIDKNQANIFSFGLIESADYNNGTYKVRISADCITDFIPSLTQKSGKTSFTSPFEIGEQVFLLNLSGDFLNCLILGSVNSPQAPPPSTSADIFIKKFKDGTTLSFDQLESNLTIKTKGKINITAQEANIECSKSVIVADSVVVESDDINLGGQGGAAAITCTSTCLFAGTPHADGSSKVKIKK